MGASWAELKSKYCCFELSTSLILCNKQQWMISWSDCNMWQKVDYIWSSAVTNSVIGLRRSSKVLPKAKLKLAPKKVMVTVWRSAVYQIHYSFLNPGEIVTSEKYAQQINQMQMKTTAFQQTGPNSPQHRWTAGHTTTSKIEWIGLWSFASSTIFTWPLANQLPLLQASR